MTKPNTYQTTLALTPTQFSECLKTWQREHGRHNLPWQQNPTPYTVLVSEIMLQQTQVATVIPYYHRWLQHFPTFQALAAANEDLVLALWQGLGYYSRARNLHRAARYVVDQFNSELPHSINALREIPGVGPYTAGAICSFAFDLPAPLVDGNVKRLFARYFGITGEVNSTKFNNKVWQLAEHYTPPQDNRIYAQALLDMGATICTPRQPQCTQCPLQTTCYARQTQCVDKLPEKKKPTPLPTRFAWFGIDYNATGVVLVQRGTDAVWPRLWCLPEFLNAPVAAIEHGQFRHVFSHYKLTATVFQFKAPATNTRVAWDDLPKFGLPAPIKRYLAKVRSNL